MTDLRNDPAFSKHGWRIVCDHDTCDNFARFRDGILSVCERHHPRAATRLSGRDLFRFAPGDIPYCGETCPGVDRCVEPDHGGAL